MGPASVFAGRCIHWMSTPRFSRLARLAVRSRSPRLDRLKGRIIAGGANNQLASPDVGRILYDRGLIYAPDFVINGGGIINVAAEIRALERGGALDPAWVETKLARLMVTLGEILDRSEAERRPTHEIAIEVAPVADRSRREPSSIFSLPPPCGGGTRAVRVGKCR